MTDESADDSGLDGVVKAAGKEAPITSGRKATPYLPDHRSASCPNSQQLHSRRPVHKNFSRYSCICRCCGLGQAAPQIRCPTAPITSDFPELNLKNRSEEHTSELQSLRH